MKSAKSRWKDACYIPASTTRERFGEMFGIFRQERGRLFNRGVVLREFLPLVERGSDILGLPVAEETRLSFWQGDCLVPPAAARPARWMRSTAGPGSRGISFPRSSPLTWRC